MAIGRLINSSRYGENNYSQGGAVDRFAQDEDALTGRAGEDIRRQTYLPSYMPYNEVFASLAFFNSDLGLSYDARDTQNDAQRRAQPPAGDVPYRTDYGLSPGPVMLGVPVGYGVPLVDPSNDYYGGDLSLDLQPQIYEPAPWDRPGLY